MIGIADVEAAAGRLAGIAHRTPVVTSRTLDERVGARLFLKAENLQRIGAFKFRGAYNAIAALPAEARATGVFTYSSGNHAQAVALAARLHGIPAAILMPTDAPSLKLTATRGYGAEVITYDRYAEDRAVLAEELAAERGATLIPPYDHPAVMAGQGTVALELLDEVDDLDLLVVPVGGGGLIAGCATVAAARAPGPRVVGVEPADRTVAREAMEAGEPVTRPIVRTIADGQQTPSVGRLTCEVMVARVAEVVGVDDAALLATMRLAFERLKLVLEPSGAAALAAVVTGVVRIRPGERVGIVLSGGNVGADRFTELTAGASAL